jgi:RNase P subunit RPR2
MKIVKHSYEHEVVCDRCKSLLYYVNQDRQYIGDMEGNYFWCVICPECKHNIKVF